ncbi:hypothetical protein JCM10207_006221 [Rhodosporidiobolus poonsookiae]
MDPDSSLAPPAASFKRKKRPQGSKPSLKHHSESDRGHTPAGEVGEQEGGEEDRTSETLDSLLALRRLKRSTAGLELDRLNAGERKKRPRAAQEGAEEGQGEVVREDGSVEGTRGGIREKDRLRDDGDAPEAKARKIVKSDNFTGQTNTVDVDKHMLAYIEAELAQKRAGPSSSATPAAAKPLDPRDALYAVSDKYKFADVAAAEKGRKDKDEEEGNVTLSAGMLMGIPEVDLGIDTKLKNIEATEKAKRKLHEDRVDAARRRMEDAQRGAGVGEEEELAVERFYRPRRLPESDGSALERARAEAAAANSPQARDPDWELRKIERGAGRQQVASDEQVMARWKKRQMQQFK